MYVYKITCIKTEKVYVGQTTKPIELRFREHVRKALKNSRLWGVCPKFHNSIRKYGPEEFTIELLDIASNKEELNAKESFWITKLDSIKSGYNLCEGGRFGSLSAESKAKISKAKIGNKARSGCKNSEENRRKSSVRMREYNFKKLGQPPSHSKKILCINNGLVYSSMKDASKKLGIVHQNISKHLKGQRTHVGGYRFKEIVAT